MLNLDLLLDVSVETEEQQRGAAGEGQVLAAALGATLVEYRRYVKQRSGASSSATGSATWRTISRLEQLRGRA